MKIFRNTKSNRDYLKICYKNGKVSKAMNELQFHIQLQCKASPEWFVRGVVGAGRK